MDFTEKAQIRIKHWLSHNETHIKEYETFAHELENTHKNESARQIREMSALMEQCNECLRLALKALD